MPTKKEFVPRKKKLTMDELALALKHIESLLRAIRGQLPRTAPRVVPRASSKFPERNC